jgi:hypothetical protein
MPAGRSSSRAAAFEVAAMPDYRAIDRATLGLAAISEHPRGRARRTAPRRPDSSFEQTTPPSCQRA